jgi:hypothetical protein
MMDLILGGCLCGSVRYQGAGTPSNATLCHCGTCRGASGSHLLGWITFAKKDFQFTAALPAEYRSSQLVVRTFCPRCGTPLTFSHEDSPDSIDVTIGSLDTPGAHPPQDHTWMSDAVEWDKPTDGLRHYRAARVT